MVRVLVLCLGRSAAAEQALSGLLDLPPTLSSLVFALRNVGAQLLCLRATMSIVPAWFLVWDFWCGTRGRTLPPLLRILIKVKNGPSAHPNCVGYCQDALGR